MEFVVKSDYDVGDKVIIRRSDIGTVLDVHIKRYGHRIEFEYLCRYDDTLGQEWIEDHEIFSRVVYK